MLEFTTKKATEDRFRDLRDLVASGVEEGHELYRWLMEMRGHLPARAVSSVAG